MSLKLFRLRRQLRLRLGEITTAPVADLGIAPVIATATAGVRPAEAA